MFQHISLDQIDQLSYPNAKCFCSFTALRLLFNDQFLSHTETSQLICFSSQLTGFYMRGTLVVKRLMQNKFGMHSRKFTKIGFRVVSAVPHRDLRI